MLKQIHFYLFFLFGSLSLFGTEINLCIHLLNRTSFGITNYELSACLKDETYHDSVQRILSFPSQTLHRESVPNFASTIIRPPKKLKNLNIVERKKYIKFRHKKQVAMQQWWIKKLLHTHTPMQEKMVLFWHNHFTSSLKKVPQPALIYRQNQLFREYALGNFRNLLHAIIEDPAMLIYLDNRSNKKQHPNENLARELLELFTLGEGHYQESDIKAFARGLTGYSLDRNFHFRFKQRIHDKKSKIFLGKRGNFNAHQMIDILLEKEEVSLFIVRKLWKYFIGYTPNKKEVKRLATLFRKNNYEMKPLLSALLHSPFFLDSSIRGHMFKSPIELVIGTLRTFNYKNFNTKIALQYTRRLGQDLLNPPNVKGWSGGEKWINTSTYLIRKSFLRRLMRGSDKNHLDYRIFKRKDIALNHTEQAAKILLPVQVYITPAHRFDITLQTILQHPLYQLK